LAALAVATLAALDAAGAQRAQSLTRAQADAIALRELRPSSVKGDVILFGLPKPLPAGTVVAPADPPKGAPGTTKTMRVPLLKSPAWLYWLDLVPYARFSHPSRFLLVDDATGRVVRRGSTQWYPAVNGRKPEFLRAAEYESRSSRVFARVPGLPRTTSGVERVTAPRSVPPGTFANDCLLMVGDFGDDLSANDWPALGGWASSVGIPTYFASSGGPTSELPKGETPTAADVNSNVDALVASGRCKDILIFLSGHGVKAASGPPTVVTGLDITSRTNLSTGQVEITERATGVTSADIEAILEEHPETTFKLKVDSCFSGRFLEALLPNDGPNPANGNLLVVETSSQASKPSYSVPEFFKGASRDLNRTMGGLTRQNVIGLRTWAGSADEVAKTTALGGSLLAHALERAFTLGLPANKYNTGKGVTPRVRTNFPVAPPPVTSATAVFQGSGTSYSLTVRNTGSEPIKCFGLLLAGVQPTAATGPAGVLTRVGTFQDQGLVGLCYSRREKSSSWPRSTAWLQVRQRPAQQRRTGCKSSTVRGSVRPAAGLAGIGAPG
jgi:hypothetical protein